MEPGWIAAIFIIVANLFGWGFTFGKLNGQVKSLKETTERHEKILNDGLVQKLSECKSELSELKGTVETYIDLTKRG
jgi:hypothetical protein